MTDIIIKENGLRWRVWTVKTSQSNREQRTLYQPCFLRPIASENRSIFIPNVGVSVWKTWSPASFGGISVVITKLRTTMPIVKMKIRSVTALSQKRWVCTIIILTWCSLKTLSIFARSPSERSIACAFWSVNFVAWRRSSVVSRNACDNGCEKLFFD